MAKQIGERPATGTNPPPGAGVRWTNYPHLSREPTHSRWLIVKGLLSDNPNIPDGLDTLIAQFFGPLGEGYGNLVDYFADVSYGALILDVDITGWFPLPFSTADLRNPKSPVGGNQRAERVRLSLEAIPPQMLPALDQYYGVIGLCNASGIDHGASYTGRLPVRVHDKTFNLASLWFEADSMYTGFAAHEVGHGLGLGHSFDDSNKKCSTFGAIGEYCDSWDIMSALNTYTLADPNFLQNGSATRGGPGMCAPHLSQLGWMPGERTLRYENDDGEEQEFTLTALSHPQGTGRLAISIQGPLFLDNGVFDSHFAYVVEYRQADGWDRGFVQDPDVPLLARSEGGVVLVHRYGGLSGSPVATLVESLNNGARLSGDTIVLPSFNDPNYSFHVTVKKIDTRSATATISIGPGPFPP